MTAASTQVTSPLTQAGHREAMPVQVEVFEAEAGGDEAGADPTGGAAGPGDEPVGV